MTGFVESVSEGDGYGKKASATSQSNVVQDSLIVRQGKMHWV